MTKPSIKASYKYDPHYVLLNSTGKFITKMGGSAGSADGQFDGPWGVAVDSSDNVNVAGFNNQS